MNRIFKYNGNAKYFTKDLKFMYTSNNFSLLNAYLNEKGQYLKIQLLNIFKDHYILAQLSPIAAGYDQLPLSNTLWMMF